MKPCHSLAFAVIFLSALVALPQRRTGPQDTAGATAEEEIKEGVVVEQVAKNSEAEKAGLHERDIILRWTRGNANGKIESPFDLTWIEIEQAQRGMVTLEGLRNGQKLTWGLGAGDWGVTSRPNLQGTLLTTYREGQDLAKAGKLAEAVERWRAGAARAKQSQTGRVDSWLLFHSAEILASARLWKEADSAYQRMLDTTAKPVAVAQAFRRRGRIFQLQNEWNKAEGYYRQAITEGERLGMESLFIARCLNSLAGLFVTQGDLDKAEEQYLKSLAIRQKLAPDSLDVAESLDGLAGVMEQRGDLGKAKEYARKEVTIAERLSPDSIDLALDLNNLGYILLKGGDLDAAGPFLRRALTLEERLDPEHLATATTLTNLGDIAWQQGNLDKAEEYHRRSLGIRQKVSPGGLGVSAGLNNLGLIYRARGNLIEAEKLYLQASTILEKFAPTSFEMSFVFTNLGAVSWQRRDLATAGEYYLRALMIAEKIGPDSLHVAGILDNLGSVAQEQRALAKAREYFLRALSIKEKIAPTSLDTAAVLNDLGGLAQEQRNDKQAKEYYERALEIEERVAPHGPLAAQSLTRLGDLAGTGSGLAPAETYYRRALEIREGLSSKNSDYAESLGSLASFLRRKGQGEEAAKLFGQAVDALESQLAVLGGREEVSSNFRAKHADYYKEYIDLLVQQKQPDLAFQMLERLRARELLKMLAAHINISKGLDSSLLARQRSLAADIAAKSSRRVRLLSDKHTEEQILAIEKEIRALGTQLEDVDSQTRKSSPDYAALTQPRPLSVKEVQEQLLDADTVLLEYDLGEERSYLWLVASNSTTTYELPKRGEIEAAARKLRDILIARNDVSKGETDVDRLSRAKHADAEYPKAAAALSRMILGPVAASIGHKRLLVVSDGILQYIPFAALPGLRDTLGSEAASWSPLIRNHEIVNLPSASVLAVLKKQMAERTPAAKTVAVLADPVFDKKDVRIRTMQTSLQGLNAEKPGRRRTEDVALSDRVSKSLLRRSASEIGVVKGEVAFPRLFFARGEADAILQDIPIGQKLKALDFKASRATATSPELYNYRIVHFATHGLLNSEHPELSGLVLSLVDEQGNEQNGFLGLEDIYNLNLRADLVVLSACETGLGKEIQGEGLVGIARGFMYAGASSVVASLWKVDDLATAEFMKVFYRGMLKDKLRPAAALRRAQIAMSKRRPSPYFWAGFVLQGQP